MINLVHLVAILFLLTGGIAHAAGPFVDPGDSYKLQMWNYFGNTDYSAVSNATTGNAEFNNWAQGTRIEFEKIPGQKGRYDGDLHDLSYLFEFEYLSFGSAGSIKLNQMKGFLGVTWWPFGMNPRLIPRYSNYVATRKTEIVTYAGVVAQQFTELRSDVLTQQIIDVVHPLLLGIQLGFRSCLPLTDTDCIAISGWSVFPVVVLGTPSHSTEYRNSLSFGGSALWEHQFSKKFSVGLGGLLAFDRLNYTTSNNLEQRDKVFIFAPVLSLQTRW